MTCDIDAGCVIFAEIGTCEIVHALVVLEQGLNIDGIPLQPEGCHKQRDGVICVRLICQAAQQQPALSPHDMLLDITRTPSADKRVDCLTPQVSPGMFQGTIREQAFGTADLQASAAELQPGTNHKGL